ncbi:MAG: peptidoglycan editing factor PgeF [Candidatus Omnitrophica bacterium]|nr:peptidoglycan editing factor PgeF [Candidatus Omnitrophota bacterium]
MANVIMPVLPSDRNNPYPIAGFYFQGLVYAFSKRIDGNMSLVYGDTKDVILNRKNFLRRLNINYQDLVCAKQVHGSNVVYVTKEDKGKGTLSYQTAICDTDALITDQKGIALAVLTADCLPVFLYDPNTLCIGLVHAGSKSTQRKITTKTLHLMQQRFNVNPQNLYVGFGPCIRKCCYEIKKDFAEYFNYGLFLQDERYHLDLAAINKKELLEAGVREENIFDCQICTSCQSKNFFSYRKEGSSCGRMMSVIMLK